MPVALAQNQGETILRQISLAELGFSSGVSFSRLSGQAEIYFPKPNGEVLRRANLVLDFANDATLENERYLKVIIDGRIARVVDLTTQPRTGRLEIPVQSAWVQIGFLQVKLEYSGGATEHYCVDERASGDFLEILETSHVAMAIDPDHLTVVDSIAALQPPQTRISLPDGPLTPGALNAALKAASQYQAEQGQLSFGNASGNVGQAWIEAHISLNPASTSTQFGSSLQAVSGTSWPSIEIA